MAASSSRKIELFGSVPQLSCVDGVILRRLRRWSFGSTTIVSVVGLALRSDPFRPRYCRYPGAGPSITIPDSSRVAPVPSSAPSSARSAWILHLFLRLFERWPCLSPFDLTPSPLSSSSCRQALLLVDLPPERRLDVVFA